MSGDRPRSPPGTLVATTAARVLDQTGSSPAHASFFGQLIDLGFPLSLYEQGPFVADGVPAITLTTGGNRPPAGFGDDHPGAPRQQARPARAGRAGAARLARPVARARAWRRRRSSAPAVAQVRGWAIELLLIALLLPYLVAVVDLYALCRRTRVPLLAAARALRGRLVFWLLAAGRFHVFSSARRLAVGAAAPAEPRAARDRELAGARSDRLRRRHRTGVARRARPSRPAPPDPAGRDRSRARRWRSLALGVVALLVVATNPFALLFVLPALHVWLWLPAAARRTPHRAGSRSSSPGCSGPASC